ncbi:DNA topoisomerase [Gamsiella multidivaricata]|uniref:DNA topoisomerase n=1 Tax=Gamsiella multidivaricata TaxID=101098 RepID=UPI002220849F|nr:DNA topoisomerase [Gamsiella multidivaricata]KAG0365746.1 DNA topoisomerase 2 [Gamsiella multidivaricata]KAI7817229.1 DNA topoisomerase [Gamsiella multidivaricata]
MSDSEEDNFVLSQDESDGYEPEVTKKVAKPKTVPKKAAAPSKSKAAKPTKPGTNGAQSNKRKLSNNSDVDEDGGNKDNDDDDATPPPKKAQKKGADYNENRTIEDIYQKKTPLEHILLRPDTYIGTTEMNQQSLWVLDPDSTKFVNRQVNIVPGLYKIVDEIIVNAADNKIRDDSMDTIKVNIDKENGQISVYNNGKGIPVEIHKKEGCYVPELIFGHLLTSSNYDDSQKKVTGGRNGYGAKLCNIFSTEFIVETADKTNGLTYKQVFSKNMSVTGKPKIAPMKKGEEFTRITFKPDFERFGMECIDADLEALLKKRTYDMAGCVKGIKVYLNGERIKIKNFKEYIEMYIPTPEKDEEKPKLIYDNTNPRWEIACIPSDGQFQQVSFVNSISTSKGGVHVDYIANQIVKELIAAVKKRSKSTNVKPFHIKSHMWVFINCLIENPAFDSQTKENMTLKQSAFGSKCELSEKFVKDVIKSPIVDGVVNWAAVKDTLALKKTDGTLTRQRLTIPKLEDAHKAGRGGRHCTLILTEGDSAKTLVMAGFSVIGRDYFGVFPLRGKLLNVRDTATSVVSNNKEIEAIKKILGLKQGKVYTSIDELRYGRLMIMTDQDHDGSHIKGLVINFFDHYFPSLLKIPGFLVEFITPIVKATKGREKQTFYTIPQYEAWKESEDGARGWRIKYYKGLGTSTKEDAKDYFSQMDRHKKEFAPSTDEARALVDMAFNKKKADERKEWLARFQPGTYLDTQIDKIPIEDFINKELILFSMADNIRSIPSMVDGLKPGQRKVIFGAFKKKIAGEIKVAQLAGYVSEKSSYHHGEQSLTMTIVGLAQDFVGSNNINLLSPNGQFGSRMQGGKDAASARYIFTTVPPITRRIFHLHDDPLLKYLNEDGDWIEPEWYIPVIPMVLVNGSDGIGTGWSSNIPNYNPMDIIANIRRLMKGEDQVPMVPWYRGFVGSIEKEAEHKYKVLGTIEEIDDTNVRVKELPIRTWTTPYKEQLESWIAGTDKTPSWIKDYRDDGTLSRIDLVITLTQDQMRKAREEGLESKFKLVGSVSTSNMVCFDPQGRIKKYSSAEEIVQEFYDLRLEYYRKRKEYLVDVYTKQWMRLDNKVRFILMIISGELQVQNRKKTLIVEEMHIKGFNTEAELDVEIDSAEVPDPTVAKVKVDKGNEYDYLLRMPIWNLTHEKVEEHKRERDLKNAELKLLIDKSAYTLWDEDLDAFIVAWEELLQHDLEEEAYMGSGNKGKKPLKGGRGRALGGPKTTVKKNLDDDDFEDTKPKKAPVVKKAVTSTAKKESSPPEIKAEVKQESISRFIKNDSASTASSATKSTTSAPKKQQSILDMMKVKQASNGTTSNSKTDIIKDEPGSADEKSTRPQKATKARSRKKILDSDGDDDDDEDFGSSAKRGGRGDDDEDVDMDDIVVEPRGLSTRVPRAARAKRPVIVDQDSDEDDEQDDFLPSPKKPTGSTFTPRKMTKSVEPEETAKVAVAAVAPTSDDVSEGEGYRPKATSYASKPKGKATYKSRTRTIASDSEGDDDEDTELDTGAVDDDDEDDYVEEKPKGKKLSSRAAPVPKPSKSAPGHSAAVSAAKKVFSLSDDGDDVDMGDGVVDGDFGTPDGTDRDIGSGPDEPEFKSKKPSAGATIPASVVPPVIVDEDDDSMFSISAPSKVSQLKKRPTLPSRKSSGMGGSSSSLTGASGSGDGGVGHGGGGSLSGVGGEGSSSSLATSMTSTGAVAGAKTLNSSSSAPPKALAASTQLLADLDDVSMIVSRPTKARSVTKKPKYVDISDDD